MTVHIHVQFVLRVEGHLVATVAPIVTQEARQLTDHSKMGKKIFKQIGFYKNTLDYFPLLKFSGSNLSKGREMLVLPSVRPSVHRTRRPRGYFEDSWLISSLIHAILALYPQK